MLPLAVLPLVASYLPVAAVDFGPPVSSAIDAPLAGEDLLHRFADPLPALATPVVVPSTVTSFET